MDSLSSVYVVVGGNWFALSTDGSDTMMGGPMNADGTPACEDGEVVVFEDVQDHQTEVTLVNIATALRALRDAGVNANSLS
jgi:hypothetical protein